MFEFAHFVDLVFLPSLILGVAIGIAWRYVGVGRLRTGMQWVGSILFFVPQPFALFLGSYTSGLRLDQQVLLALWGSGVAVLMLKKLLSHPGQIETQPGLLRRAANWRQTDGEIRTTEILTQAFAHRPQRPHSKLVLAIGAAAMAGLGVYCGWNTVGDYMLAHAIVAGNVEGARVIRNTRSPNTYQVLIDHQPYGITLDLLARMNRGDYIEAEVGVASRTIVAVRQVRH